MSKDKRTFDYMLEVLGETMETQPLVVTISSPKRIPDQLLRVAGIVLDGGIEQEVIDQHDQTAKAYVKVTRVRK